MPPKTPTVLPACIPRVRSVRSGGRSVARRARWRRRSPRTHRSLVLPAPAAAATIAIAAAARTVAARTILTRTLLATGSRFAASRRVGHAFRLGEQRLHGEAETAT